MITAKELKTWLDTLPKDAQVYVDDGGLTLYVLDSEAYLEVGGNDAQYRMFYTCTKCLHNWDDVWYSPVNSKCSECGREIKPHTVEDYTT
jgi:hypothetical protein